MKLRYRHAAVVMVPALALGIWAIPSTGSRPPRTFASPVPTARTTAADRLVARPLAVPDVSVEAKTMSLDAVALAERPTEMTARGRRAWLASEMVDATAPGAVMHAVTTDGRDIALAADAIVVRRDNGEIYVGFLAEGADPSRPLADIERPSERIEGVASLRAEVPVAAIEPPRPAPTGPPARIDIVIDGNHVRLLDKQTFGALANTQIVGHRGSESAIDLGHAFAARLVSIEADGTHVELTPPARDARAVITMNRRERFKFAWIDRNGEPIGDKQGEVTQVAMRR